MDQFLQDNLERVPVPHKGGLWSLRDVIGADGANAIAQAGRIRLHATGDTGLPKQDMQEPIAEAMATDFQPDDLVGSPAYFLHLGDVIYFNNTDPGYLEQFYQPYKHYPGKIIAIAGNHDGEVRGGNQSATLVAFLKNFCPPQPTVHAAAGTILREMVAQPGVYWHLDCPFLDLIGLYTNVADGPGYLVEAPGGPAQMKWFGKRLDAIAKARSTPGKRRALILCLHHPPYSNGGHAGSPRVVTALQSTFDAAKIIPDVVLSGHSHNYQRHTRRLQFAGESWEIPYFVTGFGGHNLSGFQVAIGQQTEDTTFDKSLAGYGYLLLDVNPQRIVIKVSQVKGIPGNPQVIPFETVTVNLANHTIATS